MHTREKPYQFKYCEKRYAQISSHGGMHTGAILNLHDQYANYLDHAFYEQPCYNPKIYIFIYDLLFQ